MAATKAAGLLSIPGAFTPTEISRASASGADCVKVFPLATVGASYIKQVLEPLDDIPLLASGGVTAALGRECLAAGGQSLGVGVGLFYRAATQNRDWASVAVAARVYLDTLQ